MGKKLKIAIIGYGKMGKEIEKLVLEKGHDITAIIDNERHWDELRQMLKVSDVAIEFTTPATAPANIERCFEAETPVVCGTTGWLDQLPRLRDLCLEKNQTLFYASNFSIGVNIFFEINRRLAGFLKDYQDYIPGICETHHIQKLDAPSGTAVSLANDILKERKNLTGWVMKGEEHPGDKLEVESFRIKDVTGTHLVSYHSPIDSIEIKHTAHNRSGFTQGTLMAAEWVYDKKGVFSMNDLLKL